MRTYKVTINSITTYLPHSYFESNALPQLLEALSALEPGGQYNVIAAGWVYRYELAEMSAITFVSAIMAAEKSADVLTYLFDGGFRGHCDALLNFIDASRTLRFAMCDGGVFPRDAVVQEFLAALLAVEGRQ